MADNFVINTTGYNIKWDATGEHYYETGTDMGVLYVKGEQADGDTSTEYGEGVAWNGLTTVNETSEGGENNDVYADNIKYLSIPGNENAGCSIEAYTYPEEFGACDGSAKLGGAYVAQQRRKRFGFAFRSRIGSDDNDEEGYKIHLYYNCLASPSERSYSTINENPEAMTLSWDVTTTPEQIGTITDKSVTPNVDHTFRPAARVIIDTRYADPDNLEDLLEILYGTPNTAAAGETSNAVAAKLPPIATVLDILVNGTT